MRNKTKGRVAVALSLLLRALNRGVAIGPAGLEDLIRQRRGVGTGPRKHDRPDRLSQKTDRMRTGMLLPGKTGFQSRHKSGDTLAEDCAGVFLQPCCLGA